MIILSQTTDIVEVKMGGAKTTNEAQCLASWRDITTSSFAPDRTVIATSGATPVNVVGSPAASTQRVVDLINVYNADTVTQTLTVQFNTNGTRYVLISAALATGESLVYQEGIGWAHLNASGAPIVSTGITAINGTAAEITATTSGSVVTLSLPTALTFTGKTITGGTFSSPTLTTPALGTPASGNLVNCTGYVGTSSLVTVGALTSGSIGSGFGSINVGSNSITGGAISGTTGTFSGHIATNGAGINANYDVMRYASGQNLFVGSPNTAGSILLYAGNNTLTGIPMELGGSAVQAWISGSKVGEFISTGLAVTGGVIIGSATGGTIANSLNVAGDVYKNNSAYTNPDYVLEKWATGRIVKYADKPGASEYPGLRPLAEVEAFARKNWHLPRFGQSAGHGIFSGSDALLASTEELYLYLFQQDAEIKSLRARVAALEAA